MNDLVAQLADRSGLAVPVVWVLGAIALALVVGSLLRAITLFLRKATPAESQKRLGSLATWWVLFGLLVVIGVVGKMAAVIIFLLISLRGLHEYALLARKRMVPIRMWWRIAYLAVGIHYLFVYSGWFGPFWTFIPVWVFIVLVIRLLVTGQTGGFLETAGITFLGLMLIGFLFSHTPFLLSLPDEVNPPAGAFGLFLFLVVLTESNDIAQALWGRLLGRRKITPTISPNKTWEGFILGALTTVALGVILTPWITPFHSTPSSWGNVLEHLPYLPGVVVSALIAVAGFFGDITVSAIKREVGVKDTGTLLPGQGGILDRIDSLTFTGPVFFYFVYILYWRGIP